MKTAQLLVAAVQRARELADVDTFVTDSGLDERTAAEIASYGPRVVRA